MYVHVRVCCYSDQSANSISSRGDYSRAASISFRACSGAVTIQERRLFESGIYSVIYGMYRYVHVYMYVSHTIIIQHAHITVLKAHNSCKTSFNSG